VKFSKTMEVRLAEATRVAVLLSPAKMSSRSVSEYSTMNR